MNDEAWLSDFRHARHIVGPFVSDREIEDKKAAFEVMRRSSRGDPVTAQELADRVFFLDPQADRYFRGKRVKRLPSIFQISGLYFVSEACAEVLRRFDLGDAILKRVEVLYSDRTTPLDESAYALAFINKRPTVSLEDSPMIAHRSAGIDWYEMYEHVGLPLDGSTAVLHSALEGPDLWRDTLLRPQFFVSGSLREALRAARLDEPFALTRCRIVDRPTAH